MSNKEAEITVTLHNNSLSMKVRNDDTFYWKETRIEMKNKKRDLENLCLYWLLSNLKPVFYNMPFDDINTKCYLENKGDLETIISDTASTSTAILIKTNDIIKEYKGLKGFAKNNKNIMFFNLDHNERYKGLYKRIVDTEDVDIVYMNMETGFNAEVRQWEDSKLPIEISDLINLIKDKKIKKIVSINDGLIKQYIGQTGVYLNALFDHLGVDFILIDNDPYDLDPSSYLRMSFSNSKSSPRFNLAYLYSDAWEKRYGLENIYPIILPQYYKVYEKPVQLIDDYKLLVLTNSRIKNVKSLIGPVIFLLDHIPEKDLYKDINLWYMAMQYMITNIMDLDEFNRLYYNSQLYYLFFTAAQFLKYDVIEALDSERQLELYGDIGWKTLFPEYYKRMLNQDEINELFKRKEHLYILLNASFSYLLPGGPVFDAAARNTRFINMPALAKSESLKGLRKIEYSNHTELNNLVNDTNVFEGDEFIASITTYQRILLQGTDFIQKKITRNGNYQEEHDLFQKELKEHNTLLKKIVADYLDKNEPFLRDCFDIFFIGRNIDYDISSSRFFNREYTQRIIRFINEEQ